MNTDAHFLSYLVSSYKATYFGQNMQWKSKHIIFCSVNIFFPENRNVYEIMWKNMLDQGREHVTIWRMHFACWIPKATNTHSGCVKFIALPLQQWLHEGTSLLVIRTLNVLGWS